MLCNLRPMAHQSKMRKEKQMCKMASDCSNVNVSLNLEEFINSHYNAKNGFSDFFKKYIKYIIILIKTLIHDALIKGSSYGIFTLS